MYPKTGGTTTTAVELEVNAKRRTAASIGKFGEEDLFRFTAASDGRYQIDTRGSTDIVMKLFGPNSETALISRLGTRPPIRNRASCRNTLHAPRSVGKVGPRVILVSEVAPRGYHGC